MEVIRAENQIEMVDDKDKNDTAMEQVNKFGLKILMKCYLQEQHGPFKDDEEAEKPD